MKIFYKQRTEHDCMLACIANAVQRPIEEIFSTAFRESVEKEHGTHGNTISEAFEKAKLRLETDYFMVSVPHTANNFLIEKLLQGRRAILQVRSLNYQNSYHMVYWAGETLYDPSNKQVYKWFNQCTPTYIWIFDEAKDNQTQE